MHNLSNFNAIAAGLLLVGGFAWFLYQALKEDHPNPEYSKPVKLVPIPAPKQPKPNPKTPVKPAINPETLKAMHIQADAERGIAEALECKAKSEIDPVKRARIEKQAALAWVRFNTILDKIDRITA